MTKSIEAYYCEGRNDLSHMYTTTEGCACFQDVHPSSGCHTLGNMTT